MQITSANDHAIFIASVTVYADNAAEALDKAQNELEREADKQGKVCSILTYEMSHQRPREYTIKFC